MNLIHERICRSDGWAAHVRETILPAVLDGVEVGDHLLELGPGPGRTTEQLLSRAPRLTALEVDPRAAERLRERLTDRRLTVVEGDATAMPFPDTTFSAVVSLTMLHHVPSAQGQDRLFTEAARVLRPGGVFAGSDGQLSLRFRIIHIGDTLTPVDPATLPDRLRAAGFDEVRVGTVGSRLTFHARRPA